MQSKGYRIADEPSGGLTRFSFSPILLLFLAILMPKPFQLLAPLVFLLNAWFMGAYNFRQQVITTVFGFIIIVGALYLVGFMTGAGILPFGREAASPYIRILFNAAFFALLYRLLLLQNPTFELISYMREQRS